MYTATGYSVQGGANLARRSRQALDDSDVIGLAQVCGSNGTPSPPPRQPQPSPLSRPFSSTFRPQHRDGRWAGQARSPPINRRGANRVAPYHAASDTLSRRARIVAAAVCCVARVSATAGGVVAVVWRADALAALAANTCCRARHNVATEAWPIASASFLSPGTGAAVAFYC